MPAHRALAPSVPRETAKHGATKSSPVSGASQRRNVRRKTRQRNRCEGDSGDDRDDGASRASSSTYSEIKSCEEGTAWACPFFKQDPWRHHRCLNTKLGKISYVKQHLYRCHSTSNEYCQSCFKVFRRREEVEEHERYKSCMPRKCPFMTNDQRCLVRDTTTRPMDGGEKWYQIWKILFPYDTKPESPYAEHVFIEVMHSYRKFCQGPGKEIVPNLLRELEVPESTICKVGNTLADRILTQIQDESCAIFLGGSNPYESSETGSTQRSSVFTSSRPTPDQRDHDNPTSNNNRLQGDLFMKTLETEKNADAEIETLNHVSYMNESPLLPGFDDPISSPGLILFGMSDNSNDYYGLYDGPFLSRADESGFRPGDVAVYPPGVLDERREDSLLPWPIPAQSEVG